MSAVVALADSLTAQLILSFIFVIYQRNPKIAFWLLSSASEIAILIPIKERRNLKSQVHKDAICLIEGPIICITQSATLHIFRLLLLRFGLSSVDNLIRSFVIHFEDGYFDSVLYLPWNRSRHIPRCQWCSVSTTAGRYDRIGRIHFAFCS